MKRLLFILWLCGSVFSYLQGQTRERNVYRYALWAEAGNRQVGIGFQYALNERWHIPLAAGLSNEFNEKKWNDWYVDVQPYFLLGNRKIQFPIGVIGGVRWVKDYSCHFPAYFYGCYGGGVYQIGRHGLGLTLGVKFGKKYHLLTHTEDWGKVEVYEIYREKPLFFSIRYQFKF